MGVRRQLLVFSTKHSLRRGPSLSWAGAWGAISFTWPAWKTWPRLAP